MAKNDFSHCFRKVICEFCPWHNWQIVSIRPKTLFCYWFMFGAMYYDWIITFCRNKKYWSFDFLSSFVYQTGASVGHKKTTHKQLGIFSSCWSSGWSHTTVEWHLISQSVFVKSHNSSYFFIWFLWFCKQYGATFCFEIAQHVWSACWWLFSLLF